MISKYENGHPVQCSSIYAPFTEPIVGRIAGQYEDEGSWGEINGIRAFSISLIATPHGSVIKSGLFHLEDLDEAGMAKLIGYENEVRDSGKELYGGRLKGIVE